MEKKISKNQENLLKDAFEVSVPQCADKVSEGEREGTNKPNSFIFVHVWLGKSKQK